MPVSTASPPSPYLVTEDDITWPASRGPVTLRVFTLEGLGIDADSFFKYMRPTFSVLHLDPYDAKRNKVEFLKARLPEEVNRLDKFLVRYYAREEDLDAIIDLINKLSSTDRHEFDRIGLTGRRKRSIARFLLKLDTAGGWSIRRVSGSQFKQKVDDNDLRSIVRRFHEADQFVTDQTQIEQLLRALATMVLIERPHAKTLEITLHQVFIFADVLSAGDNSPEGIHQDGADFVVSALVVERAGVIGGESVIYDLDKETVIFRHTLQEGEGLFHADRDALFHKVTPIEEDPSVAPAYGHRSIFGFDIDVV